MINESRQSFEEAFLGQDAASILAAETRGAALRAEQQASLALESRIAGAFQLYARASAVKERRKTWSRFRRLCTQRSPQQIARMERARGLAP